MSGFTVVIPIIFGLGFLICQHREEKLKNLVGKVTHEPPSKSLFTKIANLFSNNKEQINNKEQFKIEYYQQNQNSQRESVSLIVDKNRLENLLNLIPGDTQEVTIQVENALQREIYDAIKKLGTLDKLNKINFDFGNKYRYSSFDNMIFKNLRLLGFRCKYVNVIASGSTAPSHYDFQEQPFKTILNGVISYHMNVDRPMSIEFNFRDFGKIHFSYLVEQKPFGTMEMY